MPKATKPSLLRYDNQSNIIDEKPLSIFPWEKIRTYAGDDSIHGTSATITLEVCQPCVGCTCRPTEVLVPGITNEGMIDTGRGKDSITAEGAFAITNHGKIFTGPGKDIITGQSSSSDFSPYNNFWGIFNRGIIETGKDDDIVDASAGGFKGRSGEIHLGPGSDILKGFGEGHFYGGKGDDTILLGQGLYELVNNNITGYGASMRIRGFERIGGLGGGVFVFADGVLSVDINGVATFLG